MDTASWKLRKLSRSSPVVRNTGLVVVVLALFGVGYFQMAQDFRALVNHQTQVASAQVELAATVVAQAPGEASLKAIAKGLPGQSIVLMGLDRAPLTGGESPAWVRQIAASRETARLVNGAGRPATLWGALSGGVYRVQSLSDAHSFGVKNPGYVAASIDATPAVRAFRLATLMRTGIFMAFMLFCLLVVLTCAPELLARRVVRAETDAMTGLPNIHAFEQRMAEELERCTRYRHPVSLMMIEIDYLMTLVDTQGPVLADKVLREISEVFKGSFRLVDILSYYGEGQFMVLLPETNLRGAIIAAERLRAKIEKHPFEAPHGAKLRLTASIGLSSAPPEDSNSASMIASAERALSAAKRAGRNQVSCFNEPVAA